MKRQSTGENRQSREDLLCFLALRTALSAAPAVTENPVNTDMKEEKERKT